MGPYLALAYPPTSFFVSLFVIYIQLSRSKSAFRALSLKHEPLLFPLANVYLDAYLQVTTCHSSQYMCAGLVYTCPGKLQDNSF